MDCRKLPTPQAPRGHTTAGHTQDIKLLLTQPTQHRPTRQTHTPPTIKRATTKPQVEHDLPPTLKEIKWWTAVQSPTDSDWDTRMAQCKKLSRTAYFLHHKLTRKSTGADLEQAVMGPPSPHPIPPRLLHILYANQYQVESLEGCRCTRDPEGDSIKEWVIQWKPTVVIKQHATSMATLPSELLKAAKAEENMYDSRCVNIWWQQTNMRAVDLMEMVGRDRYDELTKEHTNRPKPNLGAPAPTCTDLHLTNAQRQGDWTPPHSDQPTLDQTHQRKDPH
jgi:hypothetical protein